MFDRGRGGTGHGVEVEGNDGDGIGELFHILACRVQLIVVVQVGECAAQDVIICWGCEDDRT